MITYELPSGFRFASSKVIHARTIIPEIFAFGLVGEGKLEKRIDGMGILDVEMGIVGGKDHVVFEAVFGNVLGGDLVAFHRAIALALEILQRRQR